MNFIDAAIFILFFAIVSVPLAAKLRLPLEIFLVIGSCLISFMPGLPHFQLNPEVVFKIFLPPILFYAAYFTSWHDFKFNLRPILLMAFGLVIFTTVAVAIVVRHILPFFSWQEAFMLGAIVSPTDASAATAVIKKMGAPRRIITILEGESLVNDASALLLFRFSLAAVLSGGGVVSWSYAIPKFIAVTLGGLGIGLILGYFSILILRYLKDSLAETTLTFVTAFTCFLVAEHFGVSGVISTVVCGIYAGIYFPQYATSKTRINANASWNTLLFIVNCFAFTLIGFELPTVIVSLETYTPGQLFFYGIAISLVVMLLRAIWVYPVAHLTRILIPSIARKDPTPSWQTLFILSWTGMRGIVSLAAVLSVPNVLTSGAPFPHRDILIFITYFVIVVTLIVPSITMPRLLNMLHLTNAEDKLREEAIARILSLEQGIKNIDELVQTEKLSCQAYKELRNQIQRKIDVLHTQISDAPYSTLNTEYLALKRLTLVALQGEKQALISLRKEGELHDEIFHVLLNELDLEEVRVKSIRM